MQAVDNLTKVFTFFSLYVAAGCGIFFGIKSVAKWLAWRAPWGIGKKVTGPAVAFTADVLLPTQFYGPYITTYFVLRAIVNVGRQLFACHNGCFDYCF